MRIGIQLPGDIRSKGGRTGGENRALQGRTGNLRADGGRARPGDRPQQQASGSKQQDCAPQDAEPICARAYSRACSRPTAIYVQAFLRIHSDHTEFDRPNFDRPKSDRASLIAQSNSEQLSSDQFGEKIEMVHESVLSHGGEAVRSSR